MPCSFVCHVPRLALTTTCALMCRHGNYRTINNPQVKLHQNIMSKTRKQLHVGDYQGSKSVELWDQEQRRLGGAWASHEIASEHDRTVEAYDWTPGWTCLTALDIYEQLGEYYAAHA